MEEWEVGFLSLQRAHPLREINRLASWKGSGPQKYGWPTQGEQIPVTIADTSHSNSYKEMRESGGVLKRLLAPAPSKGGSIYSAPAITIMQEGGPHVLRASTCSKKARTMKF